jgi:acyl carrier protein
MSPTEERLLHILREGLGVEVPDARTDIVATGLLDSLLLVTLLFEIEQEFGITVALETLDLEEIGSVERMAEMVQRATDAGSAGVSSPR